ncbi:ABC transporter ATP-binding protein [Planococcus lenghuensis]|uniref:Carnitine transport ATP-binding protein OpuCA n=1 Tax=Planococcus lenghuensis TaxID=2213202 RepID=A0A1Q2KV66_9BACL|nr:ATP-binding cassette domain-containing protein [Planococcus lenghuensis]AQQ52079.1 glycine/betaine ABC transporter ATP-binding protein [Planococcus lenghuensis]
MIRFEGVTKRFADGTEALSELSLEIPGGGLTVIIGPSGCGKTTLMKMINKLETPTAGDVFIEEKRVSALDDVSLRRSIGYVIQRIGLFPHMTISRNASLVPDLLNWPKEKTAARVSELMKMTGLDPDIYLQRYPLELSGGQQQRIGVVRALAGDPDIMLMDEPFSALDPISREQLQDELRNLQKAIRKTIVFVTHDMDEALKIADWIVIMKDGKVEQTGTPEEIVSRPASPFVEEFIGFERLSRRQTPGKQQLIRFSELFQSEWHGEAEPIASSATVEEAARKLRKSAMKQLAVMEGERLLGYVNESGLLKALLAEEGESA